MGGLYIRESRHVRIWDEVGGRDPHEMPAGRRGHLTPAGPAGRRGRTLRRAGLRPGVSARRAAPLPFRAMQAAVPGLPVSAAPLRVGVLGAGSVGREVVRALAERTGADGRRRRTASSSSAVAVARHRPGTAPPASPRICSPTRRPTSWRRPTSTSSSSSWAATSRPNADRAALGVGKPVVTANKHVLAHHGPDLEAAVRRAARRSDSRRPSAAASRFWRPRVRSGGEPGRRVRGIVNGTTNYILTRDGPRGLRLRRRAGRGAGSRATPRRTRRRRRGRRRRQQGGDPCPPRVRGLGRAGAVPRRPPSLRGRGRPRDHRRYHRGRPRGAACSASRSGCSRSPSAPTTPTPIRASACCPRPCRWTAVRPDDRRAQPDRGRRRAARADRR